MKYFQPTADASYLYRPTSAASTELSNSAAETGNLADLMRRTTVYRASYIAPVLVRQTQMVKSDIAFDEGS